MKALNKVKPRDLVAAKSQGKTLNNHSSKYNTKDPRKENAFTELLD